MPKCTELYLRLLEGTLTRSLYPDQRLSMDLNPVPLAFDASLRHDGRDWPTEALTMVGTERLNILEKLIKEIYKNEVPGDLVECGVWRGGCSIFMRAVLVTLEEAQRIVWLFDSFQGLPKPEDPTDCDLSMYDCLSVSLETVQDNFAKLGLLDSQVRFVPGWFKDTLPCADVQRVAILRLDGDMYESTSVALESLYPKLSSGGYVIIDDFGAIPQCQRAVNEFRTIFNIKQPIIPIDWTGVYWQK